MLQIRDATALIAFIAKLEKEVKAGGKWTELSASDNLETYRKYVFQCTFRLVRGLSSLVIIKEFKILLFLYAIINIDHVSKLSWQC